MAAMLLVPLTLSAQKKSGDERQADRYRMAMDLYQKQKYAAAQQIFDEVAGSSESGEWRAEAAYYAGVCSEKLDNDDAYYRLEEFLRLYPQSSRQNMARFYLGNFHYARGDYEKLLSLFQEGKSMKEIGTILGRSRGAVKR